MDEDGVFAVCVLGHFCELEHGPSFIYCTQMVHSSSPTIRLRSGNSLKNLPRIDLLSAFQKAKSVATPQDPKAFVFPDPFASLQNQTSLPHFLSQDSMPTSFELSLSDDEDDDGNACTGTDSECTSQCFGADSNGHEDLETSLRNYQSCPVDFQSSSSSPAAQSSTHNHHHHGSRQKSRSSKENCQTCSSTELGTGFITIDKAAKPSTNTPLVRSSNWESSLPDVSSRGSSFGKSGEKGEAKTKESEFKKGTDPHCPASSIFYYISTRTPSSQLYSVVRRACLRALSSEECIGVETAMVFSDEESQHHCLSFNFKLQDIDARGQQRLYSFIIILSDMIRLLSCYDFLIQRIRTVVDFMKKQSSQTFQTDKLNNIKSKETLSRQMERDQRTQQLRFRNLNTAGIPSAAPIRGGSKKPLRKLVDLLDCPNFFHQLHDQMVLIQKGVFNRTMEKHFHKTFDLTCMRFDSKPLDIRSIPKLPPSSSNPNISSSSSASSSSSPSVSAEQAFQSTAYSTDVNEKPEDTNEVERSQSAFEEIMPSPTTSAPSPNLYAGILSPLSASPAFGPSTTTLLRDMVHRRQSEAQNSLLMSPSTTHHNSSNNNNNNNQVHSVSGPSPPKDQEKLANGSSPKKTEMKERKEKKEEMRLLNQLTHGVLLRKLGRKELENLIAHIVIGNQVIVRSASPPLVFMMIILLKDLLPPQCCTVIDFEESRFRDRWECNLLGLHPLVEIPPYLMYRSFVVVDIAIQTTQTVPSQETEGEGPSEIVFGNMKIGVEDDEDDDEDSASVKNIVIRTADSVQSALQNLKEVHQVEAEEPPVPKGGNDVLASMENYAALSPILSYLQNPPRLVRDMASFIERAVSIEDRQPNITDPLPTADPLRRLLQNTTQQWIHKAKVFYKFSKTVENDRDERIVRFLQAFDLTAHDLPCLNFFTTNFKNLLLRQQLWQHHIIPPRGPNDSSATSMSNLGSSNNNSSSYYSTGGSFTSSSSSSSSSSSRGKRTTRSNTITSGSSSSSNSASFSGAPPSTLSFGFKPALHSTETLASARRRNFR